MANRAAQTKGKIAIPTIELFQGVKHGCTIVGTSVLPVPATNLVGRKGIIIQNKHATNVVYVGGGIPYLIEARSHAGEVYSDAAHDKRNLVWRLSGNGTNEWYLTTSTDSDPGLTEITYMVYKTNTGSETLATAGTVGSLGSQHNWDWGNNDTLGYNTLYVRSSGTTEQTEPGRDYALMQAYYFVLTADDTAATGGIELGSRDSIHLTADSTVQIWCIASGATTAIGTLEVV